MHPAPTGRGVATGAAGALTAAALALPRIDHVEIPAYHPVGAPPAGPYRA
ncbi:MAG: hypothetical protein ACRDOK_12615 [Streptosporangiaceae bacterium]